MGHELILQVLPPELQSAPGLICGFLTLLGLILCTAGIKVARPMAIALSGNATATLTACVLPPILGIGPWIAAVIGLAAGLLIAAATFRLVQSLVLALCLAFLASFAFLQWHIKDHPLPPTRTVTLQFAPNSAAAKVFVKLPDSFQSHLQTAYSLWQSIPLTLRQSMVVIGLGVGLLAAVIAWMAPRQSTWLMSAIAGAAIMLYGIFTLLHAYSPEIAQRIPPQTLPRLVILAGVVAAGMLVQRLYFWPGKRPQPESHRRPSRQTRAA